MRNTPVKHSVILGSGSPRRSKILAGLGCRFEVYAPEAVELHDSGDPVRTVVENALAKYRVCRERFAAAALITADTLVWFEGRLIGKPRDLAEAAGFLRGFAGRTQIVYTAVALGLPAPLAQDGAARGYGAWPDIRVEASSVRFQRLAEADIQAYLLRTRPLDRAGAYDIDENGDQLIAGHSGSYTNIMGLPEAPVRDWLVANRLI